MVDGLAAWLDLHGMTAAQMLALIDQQPPARPIAAPPLPPPEAEAIWALSAAALMAAFPAQSEVIARARDITQRNLSADPVRYPRAFTLWDPPYVSCPAGGGIGNLLAVAHEFGHAVQIHVAAAAPPPILREVAACLAEQALIAHLAELDQDLHHGTASLFQAATRRILSGQRQGLEVVLQAGAGEYRYDWNYPPARSAALVLRERADTTLNWRVFDGSLELSSLIR